MIGKHANGFSGALVLGWVALSFGCDVLTSGNKTGSLFGTPSTAAPSFNESAEVTVQSDAGTQIMMDSGASFFDAGSTNVFVDAGEPSDSSVDSSVAPTDPCALGPSACGANATCSNVNGAAACTCDPNYSGDGYNCAPVDACQTNHGNCSAYADCTSTGPGVNRCDCSAGYTGNGLDCVPE